jgi:hypothetical protein
MKSFKWHNQQDKTVSRAKESGVCDDQAAIAFGDHPETKRRQMSSSTKPRSLTV